MHFCYVLMGNVFIFCQYKNPNQVKYETRTFKKRVRPCVLSAHQTERSQLLLCEERWSPTWFHQELQLGGTFLLSVPPPAAPTAWINAGLVSVDGSQLQNLRQAKLN